MYKEGIDFVIISHCKPDYVKMAVKSIHKYVNGIDYGIYIVNNYVDEDRERKELEDIFEEDDKITILKGADQSETSIIGNDGTFRQSGNIIFKGKIDGCEVASGSKYGEIGYAIGLKVGNRKYVCCMDNDAIFLNEWTDDIIPMLEKYLFISNRWDPGNLFREASNNKPELGMARPMFWLMKRNMMEEHDLYPNCDYRDVWGNITYFAQQNGYDFFILSNSYWNKRMRTRYGIAFEDVSEWHISNKNHVIDIDDAEQAWINVSYHFDKPFLFHQTRGAWKPESALKEWLDKTGEYLDGR
jgi:hypothetical protein